MGRETSPDRKQAARLCRAAKRSFDKQNFPKSAALLRRAREIDESYFYPCFLTAIIIRDEYPQEAIDHLRRSVALEPRFQQAWYYLGATLARSMDTLEEGLAALEKAYALDPSDVWTVSALANRTAQAGNFKRARELYLKAIELEPDDDQFKMWYKAFLDYADEINN